MAIKPLDKVLLNPNVAEAMKEDVRTGEAQLQAVQSGHWSQKTIGDTQEIRQRVYRMKKQLHEECAAEGDQPTGAERDTLAKMEVELRNDITHGMLSEETMRKCPSDAPGRQVAWEQANAQKIERWRNIRQQLDPLNPEAGNLEPFRPTGPDERVRLDALIPGKMAYTHVPQEKWDQAFDPSKKVESALDQTKKWHLSEEKRREQSERMKARHARERAAKEAAAAQGAQGEQQAQA